MHMHIQKEVKYNTNRKWNYSQVNACNRQTNVELTACVLNVLEH